MCVCVWTHTDKKTQESRKHSEALVMNPEPHHMWGTDGRTDGRTDRHQPPSVGDHHAYADDPQSWATKASVALSGVRVESHRETENFCNGGVRGGGCPTVVVSDAFN